MGQRIPFVARRQTVARNAGQVDMHPPVLRRFGSRLWAWSEPTLLPDMTIDQQLAYIRKGMAEIIREEDLRERLVDAEKKGRPASASRRASTRPRPTYTWATQSCFARCAIFKDLGHQVIFLIGDMTGLIGDPTTGRNVSTRPPMTREAIEQNAGRHTNNRSSRFSIRPRPRSASTAIGSARPALDGRG